MWADSKLWIATVGKDGPFSAFTNAPLSFVRKGRKAEEIIVLLFFKICIVAHTLKFLYL